MILAYVTLFSAVSISIVAALYSLLGLAAIFSAAVIPVLMMGGVLEFAKLVTASWLYNNWNKTPLLLKSYLTIAVVVLIFITSMGIFGFLSKAHLDQKMSVGDNTVVIERIEQKIAREQRNINDSEKVIAQLDQAVQVLMDFDRIRGKDGAIAVRQSQKEERAELASIISESQSIIDELETEKLELSKEQIALEAEVGPLKYIAELIYGDEAKDHFDEAVRWVIMLLIFVFDPLAVLLLIAANQSIKEYRDEKKKLTLPTDQIGDFTELSTDQVEEIETPAVNDNVEPEEIPEEVLDVYNDDRLSTKEDIQSLTEEVNEIKSIVKEDEDTLWEKFQKQIITERQEKKVSNSGITSVEYVEEPKDK